MYISSLNESITDTTTSLKEYLSLGALAIKGTLIVIETLISWIWKIWKGVKPIGSRYSINLIAATFLELSIFAPLNADSRSKFRLVFKNLVLLNLE